MAHNPQISVTAANAAADAVCGLLGNGYLRIYGGVQPADADTALDGQTLLAELRFGATAFDPAVLGVALANAITADPDANATGAATWFRALESDGATVGFDGSVGVADCDLNMNSTAIQIHAEVRVTSLAYTQNQGA
jgi:hypothetical protein